MNRYHGFIGFALPIQTAPGVYSTKTNMVRKEYGGEVHRIYRHGSSSSTTTNEEMTFSSEIHIVADAFFNNNMAAVRYVEYMGTKWKVASIDANDPPVLKLTLGGVYNGK